MNALSAQAALQALEAHLAARLPSDLILAPGNFSVRVLDCAASSNIANVLALHPYRLTVDESFRSEPRPVDTSGSAAGPARFSVHFLLVSITDDPIAQLALLAWAIDELAKNPIIARAPATEESRFRIEIMEENLTLEALMHIWQAMRQPYRLSNAYRLRLIF